MPKTQNWIPERNQYDAVLKQVAEPREDLRYWRIYSLGIIARKLDIPKETYIADAKRIFALYSKDTDNPFTEEDLESAIKSYDDPDALAYHKELLEKLAGIDLTVLSSRKERATLASRLKTWL